MSLSGWNNSQRLRISIDGEGQALSDFPVLVKLSSSSGKTGYDCTDVFTKLGANSKKIAFEFEDSGTECYAEIEEWDNSNNLAHIHVKVPSIPATAGSYLIMYYDEAHADNSTYIGDTGETAAQNVWDSHFKGVYHMGQDPSGTAPQILDSTSNARHGTANGSMTSGDLVAGLTGKALHFDGVDDYLNLGPVHSSSICTLETVYNTSQTASSDRIYLSAASMPGSVILAQMYIDRDYPYLNARIYSSNSYGFIGNTGTGYLNDGAHHYAAYTHDGSLQQMQSDSNHYTNADTHTAISSGDWYVGSQEAVTPAIFSDVIISEVRISDIARSASWLSATQKTLTDSNLTLETFPNDLKTSADFEFSAQSGCFKNIITTAPSFLLLTSVNLDSHALTLDAPFFLSINSLLETTNNKIDCQFVFKSEAYGNTERSINVGSWFSLNVLAELNSPAPIQSASCVLAMGLSAEMIRPVDSALAFNALFSINASAYSELTVPEAVAEFKLGLDANLISGVQGDCFVPFENQNRWS